jgi:DNA-binding MarR family transcriptional regulator
MSNRGASTREISSCNGTAMRKASRRVSQLYDAALDASGLRGTQYSILSELDRRGSDFPTMAELAEALVMDRSGLGHNLKPLERDGFVTVREGKEDRRRRYITMTAKGRTKFSEAKPLWQVAQDRFIAVYGAARAKQLRKILLGIANDDRLASLAD